MGHGAQLHEAEQGPCVAQVHAGPQLQPSPQPHVMLPASHWQDGVQLQSSFSHSLRIWTSGLWVLTAHIYRQAPRGT